MRTEVMSRTSAVIACLIVAWHFAEAALTGRFAFPWLDWLLAAWFIAIAVALVVEGRRQRKGQSDAL